MYYCEVITRWVEHILDVVCREMDVALTYPGAWSDATGQPDINLLPDPNALIASGVVDEKTLDTLQAEYGERVLIAERIIEETGVVDGV